MPSRRFPKPWNIEPVPGGYLSCDRRQGRCPGAYLRAAEWCIAVSDSRLTNDEARRISKLIARLPKLGWSAIGTGPAAVASRSRSGFKPLTIGDLIREGKLLEVQCGA